MDVFFKIYYKTRHRKRAMRIGWVIIIIGIIGLGFTPTSALGGPLSSSMQHLIIQLTADKRSAANEFEANPTVASAQDAIASLGEIYPQAAIDDPAGQLDAVLERIDKSEFNWRLKIVQGLEKIRPSLAPKDLNAMNIVLYRMAKLETSTVVAKAAVKLLGDSGQDSTEKVQHLRELGGHTDYTVRSEVVQSLKRIGANQNEPMKRKEVVNAMVHLPIRFQSVAADVVPALEQLARIDVAYQNIIAAVAESASPFVAEQHLLDRFEALKTCAGALDVASTNPH